jgi:hypothetical protein
MRAICSPASYAGDRPHELHSGFAIRIELAWRCALDRDYSAAVTAGEFITNPVGNALATLVLARRTRALDMSVLQRILGAPALEPENRDAERSHNAC